MREGTTGNQSGSIGDAGLGREEVIVPTVSIGVPVYNGERYLGAMLDAVLAQSFTDLEVVICDNASSDATGEICEA